MVTEVLNLRAGHFKQLVYRVHDLGIIVIQIMIPTQRPYVVLSSENELSNNTLSAFCKVSAKLVLQSNLE
jgi:hypothetical protein